MRLHFLIPSAGRTLPMENMQCASRVLMRGARSLPSMKIGVFPLPNDTVETTNSLSGIDAAVCVSAKASDEEKEAAYRFLAYLAEPENAQIFCNNHGAPSCINGVVNDDTGVAPMVELINAG